MLHTKPQGHWPFGSGEEIFEGFLLYMGVAAIFVIWPRPSKQIFVSPTHGGSIWNLASIGPIVLEKKIFENGGWTTDNGRTTEHAYSTQKMMSSDHVLPPCSNVHALPFIRARDVALCLKLALVPYIVWGNREGSGKSAHLYRLARMEWSF